MTSTMIEKLVVAVLITVVALALFHSLPEMLGGLLERAASAQALKV